MAEQRAARLEAIARLDAELMAAAAAPPQQTSASVASRVGYLCGGALSGWMFGGAVAGAGGVPFCLTVGTIAGIYRASTGRKLLDALSDGNTPLPGPGSANQQSGINQQLGMLQSQPCNRGGGAKPPC